MIEPAGTIATVASAANTGTASIAVPADATMALVFWLNWPNLSMLTLTIGGQPMTIPVNSYFGGAYLVNPPTGTQTFEWDYVGAGASSEGTPFLIPFYKGGDTADPVRDAAGAEATSVDVDSEVGDYIAAAAFAFNADPDTALAGQTTDLNNFPSNNRNGDVFHVNAPGSPSTTVSATGTGVGIIAITMKAAAAAGGPSVTAQRNRSQRPAPFGP